MRWSALSSLVIIALSPFVNAAPPTDIEARSLDRPPPVKKDAFGRPIKPSYFNEKEVPPLRDVTGNDFDGDVKSGYWLLEFYSPWCHHCEDFAPTLQTFYELYYTSEASPASESNAADSTDFSKYYDFRFGRLDCVANGDACKAQDIGSFPTLVLFKDGKLVKKSVGGKDLKELSAWLEEELEKIRPGSRPKNGLKLPKVGADHVDKAGSSGGDGKASTQQSDTSQVVKKSKTKSDAAISSPDDRPSSSVSLTRKTFLKKVTNTYDSWFIKFYAPWCPHCLHLAPSWQSMARSMEGQLNIGEVNCEVEKQLCKELGIKAFPTLFFFQGGTKVEYEGLRGLGDLLSFAEKATTINEGVRDVSADDFAELEKKEEVIFLYLYDHATTNEDFQALERHTIPLVGRARLVKSSDPKLWKRFKVSTWPRLLVSRDGKPSYFPPIAPRDMRDYYKVLEWMRKVWLPIVPELTSANAKEVMNHKLVVLGVLSRDRSDEFIIAKREIKNAALEWLDKQTQARQLERQELRDAKQLRIEEAEDRNDQRALRNAKSIRINMDEIERKEVAFAWVDGTFWERWIKTTYGINVKDGERVIVNDEENQRYWDTTVTGNPIVPSRTSILETLPKIVANPPKLSSKSTLSFLGHIASFLSRLVSSRLLNIVVIVSLIGALALYVLRVRRRNSNTLFPVMGANGTINGGTFQEKKGWGNTGSFFQLPLNGKDGSSLGGLLGNGGGQQEKAD